MSEDTNVVETIFQELVAEGKDKNAIIMELAVRCGIDVTTSVREYQRLAKTHGLILSSKDRALQIDLLLADVDVTDAAIRRQMVETISDKFDVSEATAMQHVRSYAEANAIELPSSARTPLADLIAFVKARLDEGKTRADTTTDLVTEFGYSENSANSAYSRVLKELGLTTGRSGVTYPLDQLVALIRANETLPKKALLAKICEEAGYAESTANSFLIYLNFAREYAKQVVAELPVATNGKRNKKAEAEAVAE